MKTQLSKPVGTVAVSQVRITTARQFWVVAAERETPEALFVHADEMLTAFLGTRGGDSPRKGFGFSLFHMLLVQQADQTTNLS